MSRVMDLTPHIIIILYYSIRFYVGCETCWNICVSISNYSPTSIWSCSLNMVHVTTWINVPTSTGSQQHAIVRFIETIVICNVFWRKRLGWAMCQPLFYADFRWFDDITNFNIMNRVRLPDRIHSHSRFRVFAKSSQHAHWLTVLSNGAINRPTGEQITCYSVW